MKSHMKLWVFAILASIVSQNFQSSTGLTIDKNGGYHVVLAIKNDEAKPTHVDTYINSIKQSFRTLSGKMWIATRESFYIAKLDIILPQSWEVEGNLTLVSYPTADIRVSSANKFPYVENNNLCDLPGDFIELPKNLFDNEDTGDLGDNWKVLLVPWARYRWGAYEEHGAPGDKQFPYFVRDVTAVDDEPKWVPNGCTNGDDKLVGAYKNLDGTPCDPTSTSDLDLTCRFYPDKSANVNVTSSLMHFHFMDSVYEFCNATTHKKNVPTKQNVYCDNKSVMETIESSPDFKAIENKNTYVPELQTEVSVSASKPPLYILLDNGLADNNGASVLNQVIPILGKFFNDIDTTGDHKELIVGVGEFPTEETKQYLKPLVPLGLLSQNKDAVVNAIGNRNAVNLSGADFGVALQQAAAIIKASSPVDGGNILFVKTSGAKNITDFSTEKKIELTLRRDNIKLFTLEIVDMAKTRQNLVKIATETQGDAIAYSRADRSKIPTEFREWLEKLLAEYSSPPTPKRVERIAYSDTEFNNTRYVYIGSLNTVGWDLKELCDVHSIHSRFDLFGHNNFPTLKHCDARPQGWGKPFSEH
ncbi:unnamed protein product [Allacma fusca]|uniref:VWFA domain-containing protein n=1 Tax=Allacma fusca TaxID=39272 RepID=A0A8J2KUB5_9HEXA|nr:unnamed protein product [Allacma fusca]